MNFLQKLLSHTKIKKTKDILKKVKSPVSALLNPSGKASLYYVEILSDCDLKCALCPFGHRDIFQRKHGKMSLEHFQKILDKIQKESPSAMVCPYHQCEPSLHPDFLKMIKEIKNRGFTCAVSSNFNNIKDIDGLVKSGVDSIEISVSGFYQEAYGKSHIGGNIEKVKENMKKLREIMNKLPASLASPRVQVIYHMYKDNLKEDYDQMKAFTESLGFVFAPCWSRAISMELSLKYL